MECKTTVWIFQVTNWQDCTQKYMDKTKKENP